MFSIKCKMLRTLLSVVFIIAVLVSYSFTQPFKLAEAAAAPLLSGGELKTAPVLTADKTQNVIRKPVELTFTDDITWRGAMSEVSVDGVALDTGKYAIEAGKITINKAVFQTSKDYDIVIKAKGFANARVTQTIGLLYLSGDGVSKEVVFTRAELEAMNQKKVLFSATNDFPVNLFLATEGVPLKTLLTKAGLKSGAQMITFMGTDGYKGEFTIDELLHTPRYKFPDKTLIGPIIALKRVERSTDFSKMNEMDTPVLCFGQRAQTEQTLLGYVKVLQNITVTTSSPEQWAKPTAQIIDPDTQQKTATQGGEVKKGSKIILEGDPKIKIYYTTDGTEPNLDSRIFNEHGCGPLAGQDKPVLVQTNTTIKAKAIWGGKRDSEVVTFTFTVAGGTQSVTKVGSPNVD